MDLLFPIESVVGINSQIIRIECNFYDPPSDFESQVFINVQKICCFCCEAISNDLVFITFMESLFFCNQDSSTKR